MPEMGNILLYNLYSKSNSDPTNLLRIICFQIHSFLIRTAAGKLNVFLLLFLLTLTAIAALYTEYIIQV